MKHRRYQCKICQKEDRKGRLVGHVLKYHVPMDRVPFSCSLCNFRCTDKKTLVSHLNSYQRHKDEVLRSGITNLASILNKAENPVDVEALVVPVKAGIDLPEVDFGSIDSSIFEPQDPEEPQLPDWLATSDLHLAPSMPLPQVPTQNQICPSVQGFTPRTPGLATLYSPIQPIMRTPVQPLVRTSPVAASVARSCGEVATSNTTISLPVRQTPMMSLEDLLHPLPLSSSNVPGVSAAMPAVASTLPSFVTSTMPSLASTTQPRLTSGNPITQVHSTPTGNKISLTLDTPVQDENVYVLQDILDNSYTSDPLFQECTVKASAASPAKEKSPPSKTSAATQTATPPPSEDTMNNILMAINSNGRELHAVNRNLRSILDQFRNFTGAFTSLERTIARSNSLQNRLPRRSPPSSHYNRKRSSCSSPGKENVKSVVKKVKK